VRAVPCNGGRGGARARRGSCAAVSARASTAGNCSRAENPFVVFVWTAGNGSSFFSVGFCFLVTKLFQQCFGVISFCFRVWHNRGNVHGRMQKNKIYSVY
jgi:hypothetical protein